MTISQSLPVHNPPRRHFTRQRRALTERERRRASRLASTHLLKLRNRLPNQAKVGIYLDAFGELPTQPILDWCHRGGFTAYLPVVGVLGSSHKQMHFAAIKQSKLINVPTLAHTLGMRQPAARDLLMAKHLDAIFCPLVAADLCGNRMGMGGGYYDSTLARCYRSGRKKPLRIGWCYEFQVVDRLISQPWDVPLDALITPKQLRWF